MNSKPQADSVPEGPRVSSRTPLLRARARPSLKGSIFMGFFALILAVILGTLAFFTYDGNYHTVHDVQKVGRLPAMGYNTWNAYYCNINEELILQTAQLVKVLGLQEAGYNHMNLDDCYSERERSPSGDIVASKTKFPSGMKALTDQLHALGFQAGIYSDSGWFTCQIYPGSYQNEARDVKLFHDWGFDYLKYDNCAVPFDNITRENIMGRYERMANAIADLSISSGKPPLLLSMCQWGREQGWLWAKKYGQSWRTTNDIQANWRSIASIINQNSFYTWASDFYGHNDMDILEVGNGDLNYEETKTHFTAWALMKSPLLISADLNSVSKETLEILTNMEIIAINQDPVVGTSVSPFRWGINPDYVSNETHPAQYWSGESQNGTVFMLINTLDEPATMFFNLTESPWIRAGRQYFVRDLWSHTDNGTAVRNFTAKDVPAHGVVTLLLQDAGDEPEGLWPPCAVIEWCMGQDGTMIDPDKKWHA
ncbi:glycoside hydrolase family 27 protein [Phlebopus sp. FC_14]|nr:glycoside hydrolase family 27 protein [Phlebopus sp. FC_14]